MPEILLTHRLHQVGVVVDVLANFVTGGLEFVARDGEYGLDGVSDRRVGGI